MRNQILRSFGVALLVCAATLSYSQYVPGSINRPATSVAGRGVLDPNTTFNFPGNTSKFATGFGGDDVGNSEIPYKPIPALSIEPFADLRRGPNHSFSDFVPDGSNNGVYAYFDNTNLLFRFRMGSVMSGSKGYSVLLDTDGRFGATGAAADPTYAAATTGTNGNPGFEIEIVLETNFQIAIYNVDGGSSPVLIKSYTAWQDMSQVSIAASNDNGDPDFFMDFYIPFSDLQAAPFNLTASSPIRMSATTVMAPKAAIGGPKSDIYGVNDAAYSNTNDAYEAYIKGQCGFSATSLQTSSSCAVCTEPPVLSSPIGTGVVNITGSWTKSSLAVAQSSAQITVYKNTTTVLGTINNVASGSSWTLNNVTINSTDIITARAVATGESMCYTSNAVVANNCNSNTRPAKPALTCATTNKGMSGNNLSTGWTLNVENTTRGTVETITAGAPNTAQFTLTGTSPNISWDYSSGCSGGANMQSGSYKVYYTNSTGCVSEPVFFCVTGNGGSAMAGTSVVPQVTLPANGLTTATSTVSGTGEANSTVALYLNGTLHQTVTAGSGGAFTFSNLSLLEGQRVYITNIVTVTGTPGSSKCLATSVTYNVTCNTSTPLLRTDANGGLAALQPITGTASKSGEIIRIYSTPATLVATTTAGADGSWSTGSAGTTPAAYNAVATTSYYATAQNGTCGVSGASATATALTPTSSGRCGAITGTIAPNETGVSGSLTGSFTSTTVNLYLDGTLIGTTSTNTNAWGPIATNTVDKNTALYANGVLTIGLMETNKAEVHCPLSAKAITCNPTPVAPTITPENTTISQNGTVTYTIANAAAGTFYALSDSTSGEALGAGTWAPSSGSLSIATKRLSTTKTYTVLVKATSLSGVTMCTSTPGKATIVVSSILPANLLHFGGQAQSKGVLLLWDTEEATHLHYFELERSGDGVSFKSIVRKGAKNGVGKIAYSYEDSAPESGRNFYRLKIVDEDGSFTYSKTILFTIGEGITIAIAPNPFKDALSVQATLPLAQKVKIVITNVQGSILKELTLQAAAGSNTWKLDGLGHLPKGVFLLKVHTRSNVLQQKIIKID